MFTLLQCVITSTITPQSAVMKNKLFFMFTIDYHTELESIFFYFERRKLLSGTSKNQLFLFHISRWVLDEA